MSGPLGLPIGDEPTLPLPDDVPPVVTGPAPDKPKRGRPKGSGTKASTGAADRPPSKSKPTSAPGAGRPSNRDVLARRAAGAIALVGDAVSLVEPFDGGVIKAGAAPLGAALAKAAETNPMLKRMLEGIGTGSGWAEVAIAAAAIALPIAAHHGLMGEAFKSMGDTLAMFARMDMSEVQAMADAMAAEPEPAAQG